MVNARDRVTRLWRECSVSMKANRPSVMVVASAVNSEGFREIVGICEGAKEDKSEWSAFLRHLVDWVSRAVS